MGRRAGLGHKAHETRVGPQRVEAGGSQPEPQRRAARPRPASGGTPPVAATSEWPTNTAGAFAAMSTRAVALYRQACDAGEALGCGNLERVKQLDSTKGP